MSDIYLTKVERKTIFTQGLIYVLFTFVISDLTVTGPHIFSIVPWLFFLGIMGVNKFYHPIMTVILSTFTSFMASIFKYSGLNINVLTSTLVTLVMTTAGIVVGVCIREFVLEHRLVKQLSVNKKIMNILVIALLTIGSIILYAAKYGNVIGYIKSRTILNKYVTEDCSFKEYEIENLQFLEGSFDKYIYIVKVEDERLNLKVTSKVELINFQELKDKHKLELDAMTQNETIRAKLNYEYDNTGIKPSNIIATINKNNLKLDDEKTISEIIADIIKIINFKDKYGNIISKIMLSINGGLQVIEREDFNKISEEYIKNSINVEIFDIE